MNHLIVFVSTTAVITAALVRLGWTDRLSLGVVAASLATAVFIGWIYVRSVNAASRKTSVSSDDTPLAAILFGFQLGVVLFAFCLVGFGLARMGGLWSPSRLKHSAGHQNDLTSSLAPVALAPARETGPLQVKVESVQYVQPILFVEAQVLDGQDRPVEALTAADFVVGINGGAHKVHGVTPIQWESPLHVAILRDASGSVRGKPYPELIVAATEVVRQSLQSLPRSSSLRVANFSDAVIDVSAWSSDLKSAVTSFNPAAARAELSAIVASTVSVLDDLGHRNGGRRIVLVTDGGNNVPSDYSATGLIAHARRNAVTIDVVALPTEHLQEAQRAFLQAIARQTGGVYVDAANPTATRELQRVLIANRDLRAAYRLTIDCPNEVRPDVVTVDVRTHLAAPTGTLADRPSTPEAP